MDFSCQLGDSSDSQCISYFEAAKVCASLSTSVSLLIYVPSESENARLFVDSMTCLLNHLLLLDFLHASLLHATSILEDGFEQQGKIRASSNVAALKQVAVDAISAMPKPSIFIIHDI